MADGHIAVDVSDCLGIIESLVTSLRKAVNERDELRVAVGVASNSGLSGLVPGWMELLKQREELRAQLAEWDSRTEWIQDTHAPQELGMHRADVLRQRIEALESECAALRSQVAE